MSKQTSIQTNLLGRQARYARSWGPVREGSPMFKHWDEWGEVVIVKDGGEVGPGLVIRWNDGTLSIELAASVIEIQAQEELASQVQFDADGKIENPKFPKCGHHNLQIWEDAIISRDVNGLNDSGILEVNGMYESDGDGDNARFHCVNCGHIFPIPEDIEIEYV